VELRLIRYFLAIAQEQSFTKAAARLNIGQPPLSQQIKAMELEMQVRLFRRLSHGVELTAAGKAFLDAVVTIPGQISAAVQLARKVESGVTGTLRLGFTGTAALNPIVPTCIRQFRDRYPAVEIRVMEANSLLLNEALRNDRLDVAVVRGAPTPTDDLDLFEDVLDDEELLAALPAAHPLAGFERVKLAELRTDPFVLTARNQGINLHDAVLLACEAAGFVPQLGPPAPQIASIVSLVSAGLGVSLVPASVGQIAMHGVVLRRLQDIRGRAPISLAFRRDDDRAVVGNFVDLAHRLRQQKPDTALPL
jgi:DNA-binding transcriptional LysR family regulator